MNGRHQVTRTVEVDADPAAIWGVIADSALLPQWASVVKDVTYLGQGQEGVGMTRHCNVELGGRTGTMTERCVEFDPNRRVGYVVDDDTLGFSRMLRDYGFTITLEPRSDRTTGLRIDTYYTPRNPLYALLNRLLLKRRMRKLVDGLLQGLKQISQRRGAAAAVLLGDDRVLVAGRASDPAVDQPVEVLHRGP
jgi:uncharacterized protein YndB with AHSA1/START domain